MANYILFKSSIEAAEGGYQNFETDLGNFNSKDENVGTNHGISARFYEDIRGFPPSVSDMKAITKSEAHILFKNEFWDKVNADAINSQAVAETIVDHAINAGVGAAGKVTQVVLNEKFKKRLTLDRSIGAKTIEAINSVNESELFNEISLERLEDYKTKNNYNDFKTSWISRVQKLAVKFGVEIKKKKSAIGWVLAGLATVAITGYIVYEKNNKKIQRAS